MQKLFYPFPTEHLLLNLCEGVIAPVGRWEINVGWRKSKRLRPYTCTDCPLKTEDCRSCENQAKVGSVMSQRTRHFSSYRRNYGQRLLR
ncbi:hypothetical protein FO522_29810 [Bacillus nitratireducens]|nr:hypothetical protein [Bacillus nitratireducens]